MKKLTLLGLGLCINLVTSAQIVRCLPETRLFAFPNENFDADGTYVELHPENEKQVRFSYSIVDGKRHGPMVVYDSSGNKVAQAEFENNRLKNGSLLVYAGDKKIKLILKKDNPGWLFSKNWDCKSGTHEEDNGLVYIWLAGNRYRLPNDVRALDL